MKKLLVLLAIGMVSSTIFAQVPGGNPSRGGRGGQQLNGIFYGRVVDEANKGISAASVTLVRDRMDSATKQRKEEIVGGMLTQNNGDFSIENVPAFGRYKLRVTAIGYKPYEQNVSFNAPNRNAGQDQSAIASALDKDLGNIKLSIDSKVLSDVTVTASKPLLQLGIDRKVFNVDKNVVSAGGTAVDVMRNVPSVSVDIDGNVSLRNSSPQIFVDGRVTTLTLDQIPADNIESVEIITNPSPKYDASGGTAGILNIILKKNKRVGYSGNVRANVDSRGRFGGGGDINVRQGKVNFFASANYSQRKSLSTGTTTRQTLEETPNTFLTQVDRNNFNGNFSFLRGGFDFFINNRNTITVSGSYVKGKFSPDMFSRIYIDSLETPVKSSYAERLTGGDREFNRKGAQLSYKHNFIKAGRELTADINYDRSNNPSNNLITTNNFDNGIGSPYHSFSQKNIMDGDNEYLVAQTDFTNPIDDKTKLEAGLRTQMRKISSNSAYYTLDPYGNLLLPPTSATSYSSTDYVHAAYVTYSKQLKTFSYMVGLRAESSNYTGNMPGAKPINIDFPISLFPSVFFTKKLDESQDLQLNYSRRINRPNFWQLFPFVDSSDLLNISRGNPGLKPEFTNSIEMSYQKTFKNRDNFLASIYYKNTNDLITRNQIRDSINNKSLLVNTYINANTSYVTGLELISKNSIAKWWELTSNFNLYTSKIKVNDPTAVQPGQFVSYFAKLNSTFKLPKNFTIQLSGDYQSKTILPPGTGSGGGRGGFGFGSSSTAQGYIRPYYGVDAAVRFEFLKNKAASLSLNVNDIFKTRKYGIHSESIYFIQDAERIRDAQIFRLNFNYRFGKFDASLFKRKNNRGGQEDINSGMEGVGM